MLTCNPNSLLPGDKTRNEDGSRGDWDEILTVDEVEQTFVVRGWAERRSQGRGLTMQAVAGRKSLLF